MSKFLTFASGWYNEEHGVLYCKSKEGYGNLYDSETKKGERIPLQILIRNQSGEELEVKEFRVVTNLRRRDGKNDPTHEIKVKLG